MKIQLPLLLASATVLASSAARAATFNVTSTVDAGAGNLRQAVLNANASSANDTITFASNGVFVLISGALEISNKGSLTINGAAGISISGNNTSRIFFIDSDAKMTINNVTLRNGNDDQGGSAIVNDGVLTLDKCTLANNTTTNGAGAIYNLGRLIVTNSTFAGNTASYAGAILNDTVSFKSGDPTPAQFTLLRNCTFSGNSGSNLGGALVNIAGLMDIQSCTIAGNRADSGAGVSSFSGAGALTDVDNSIIADNHTLNGPDHGVDVDLFGEDAINSFDSGNYNAIGYGNATAKFNKINDQTAVTAAMLQLGALADNGGPTQTRALGVGSNAVDLGNSSEATDQRGVARSQKGADDIGAFELTQDPTGAAGLVVTTLQDAVAADGLISLREAMNNANNDGANSAITFAVKGTIQLATQLPAIISNGAFSLVGPAAGVTIEGSNSQLFSVNSAVSVTFSGLTLRGGYSHGDGGAISGGNGPLIINNCKFAGNTAIDRGGAISNFGPLTITGCTFSANAAARGGAIFTNTPAFVVGQPDPAQNFTVKNSTFSGNSATNRGGAIYNENGLTLIQSCTIAGNRAPAGQGAGIAIYGDNSTRSRVQNSIIADNRAGGAADSGSDVDYIGGTNSILSQGHNAIGDGNAAAGFAQTGDKTGVTAAQLKLGALNYNGGPTQTLALLPGSVAIDAGATNLTTDQRGVQRPIGAAADIGAFEAPVPNAAPSVSNASVQTLEDKPFVFRGSNFGAGFSDPNAGDSLQSVRIDTLPKHGALKFKGQAVGVGKIMARANIGNLIFVPAADFNGTTNFKFSASDGALFSVKSATMTIQIVPVNDAPSFTLIGDQIVAQTSAPQNVKGFATALKVGPDNETGQTLTLLVSNDNAALFSQQPSINSNGTLNYTLLPKALGVAHVKVTARDNGGTKYGGIDTSGARTFALTVTLPPINFSVRLQSRTPQTNDTLTATPLLQLETGLTIRYEWFVNGVSARKDANNTFDLSKPGNGDAGDTISVLVTARKANGATGTAQNAVTVSAGSSASPTNIAASGGDS